MPVPLGPVAVGLAAIAVLAALSFIPTGQCNVQVDVTNLEVSLVVATYFQVTAVNPHVIGKATILDWQAWGLGFATPTLSSQFTETVQLSGPSSYSASKTQIQWLNSVPVVNGQQLTATDSFYLGYVGPGAYAVNVNLQQGGTSVASGSGSLTVGC